MFNLLGSLLGGAVGKVFGPKPATPPPPPNLGQFLQQHIGAPAAQASANISRAATPVIRSINNVPVNFSPIALEAQMARLAAPHVATTLDYAGGKVAQGINKVDHNYKAPIIGNVGQAVGSLVSAPAVTVRHTGQILTGKNPYQGMTPGRAAGAIGIDALNAATLGKGTAVANGAERLAAPIIGRVGNKVASNVITRAARAAGQMGLPSAGYGVAGALEAGQTNPLTLAGAGVAGFGSGLVQGTVLGGKKPVGTAKSDFTPHHAPDMERGFNPHLPAETNQAIRGLQDELDNLKAVEAQQRTARAAQIEQIQLGQHPLLDEGTHGKAVVAQRKAQMLRQTDEQFNQQIAQTQAQYAAAHDAISKLDPSGKSHPTFTARDEGVPLNQAMPYDHKPTLKEKLISKVSEAMGGKNDHMGFAAGGTSGPTGKDPLQAARGFEAKAKGQETPLEQQIKENKFTQSVKTSPEVSAEVRGEVSGQHVVRNTKQLMDASREEIRTKGLAPTTEDVLNKLSVASGKASDTDLARALEVAKAHDALGTEAGHSMATSLYDQISEHGVAKGQGVQILSQIARSSPAGLRNKAFKDLKKAGVNITPELTKEIQGHIDAISKLPEGSARDMAVAVLQKSISKHLPQGKIGNAISVWKAGLLSGVKTQGGNLLSNGTFGVLKKVSDVPAALADQAMAIGTGNRTKTLTFKGATTGAAEGVRKGAGTLKTGIDQRNVGDKWEQHAELNFKNPLIQKVFGDTSNGVFRAMSAADQPFYYSALKNSLYDQAKAAAINEGVSLGGMRKRMNELVQNPTEKMVATATKDAQKSVLGFDTVASKVVSGAHRAIDNMNIPGPTKAVASGVLNVLAPFVKVPSAFLSRTVDFTPLGVGREAFEQIAKKQFDQRALATAIGEGATGTGIVALGMALAGSGRLSGSYPSKDPKEAARWNTERKIPNAVKLGGTWISLNYLGPLGMLLGAGKNMHDAKLEGTNQLVAAATGLGQGLLNQSFLQGLSGASDALKDPARFGQTFLNSQIASVVPAWSNDLANATDSMQRQANTPLQAARARIPGFLPGGRTSLAPKIDSFGNDLTQAGGTGLNTAVNPLKPSQDNHTPLLSELDRLGQTSKENVVFPTAVKSIGQGKDLVKLTPEQSTERQKLVGSQLTPLWNSIIASPSYAKLTDDQKSTALQSALKDVNGAADRSTLSKIDSSKLTKAATGSVAAILAGKPPSAETYIAKALRSGTGSTAGLSPADKYTADLAKYQADKAAGKLTGPKDLSARQLLQKEAITSKYSQDVLDFYGLSKAEQNAYFKQNPTEAKSLYDQAKQLDAQLGRNKYKYGLSTKAAVTRPVRIAKARSSLTAKLATNGFNKSRATRVAKVAAAPKVKFRLAKVTTPKLKTSKRASLTA